MNKNLVPVLVAIAGIFIFAQLCFATPTAASSPIVSVEPSYINTSPWQTFTVNITIDPSDDEILGAQYELYFNPRVLQVVSQTQGTFLSPDGKSMVINNSFDNYIGKTTYAETRTVEYGVNTPGVLASITFETRYIAGNSTLNLKNVILVNTSGECSDIEINDGLAEIEVTPALFSLYGYVFYENGSECDNPTVKITNLNTGSEWTADTKNDSNYYRCNLTAGIDVGEEDILLFRTTSPEEQQINTTLHKITRAEINNGGIFDFNFSLEPVRHDINISTDYYPPTGIKIENATAIIPPEQHLTHSNTYFIKYKVENQGNIEENVNVRVKVANESWESIINDYNRMINPGEYFEGNESWSPLIAPGNYAIIVNATVPVDDNTANNNRSRDVIIEIPQIDLSISELKINPTCTNVVNKAFSNESNEIQAIVWNNGTDDAGRFNLSFKINGELINKTLVEGLSTGSKRAICILWKPNKPGDYQLNVTADSDDDLIEINESNNFLLIDFTVYNNGYKGKRYTGGEDIKTVQKHSGKINLTYSVGDSYFLTHYFKPDWTQYVVNWSADDFIIPDGSSIQEARLYVYYCWDDTPGGNITDFFNLTFNEALISPDAHYTDTYDTPSGMLAYNVTSNLVTTGKNTAILINSYPGGGNVSMLGMLLLVVYEHAGEPQRLIWINEGFDLLRADDNYCVNSTEATAFAPFEGTINMATVESAKLITIAPQACDGDDKNRLYFNDGIWNQTWKYAGDTYLGINETNVIEYILPSDNMARIQSYIPSTDGTNFGYMDASNAILVVEGKYNIFDTGPGGYPSIMGVHYGTIIPSCNISVSRIYTYPCAGTGGHIEYIKIWIENTSWNVTATWEGYTGDHHNISFNKPFILQRNTTYNYMIKTGSYPQIIHAKEYNATGGEIKCKEFIDANGKRYTDWIPAIRLYQ